MEICRLACVHRDERNGVFCFVFIFGMVFVSLRWIGEEKENIGIDFGIIFKESRMSGENFG